MAGSFHFVSGAHIDEKSRREIRSHVMKGRNAGKRYRLRNRPLDSTSIDAAGSASASTSDSSSPACSASAASAVCPSQRPIAMRHRPSRALSKGKRVAADVGPQKLATIGSFLSGMTFAEKLTPMSGRLLYALMLMTTDAIYPREFCTEPSIVQFSWFKYLHFDEAYFHAFLALSASSLVFLGHDGSPTTPALQERYLEAAQGHLNKALSVIGSRLSSQEALSNATLSAIIHLCVFESMRPGSPNYQMHFEGMCKIIELRGGLSQMQLSPDVLAKIFRIDLDMALRLSCRTRFSSEGRAMSAIDSDHPTLHPVRDCPMANDLVHINPELVTVIKETMQLSYLLNTIAPRTKIEPYTYYNTVSAAFYRLLDISLLPPLVFAPLEERLVFVGTVVFMTSMMLGKESLKILAYDFLYRMIYTALDEIEAGASVSPDTQLWFLLIVSGALFTEDGQRRIQRVLPRFLIQFQIKGWPPLQQMLRSFPWVRVFHDELAKRQLRALGYPVS
ncbi:hypothetical protein B0I35DRAFT_475192 [Stachybotrys elegans]|uniref:Transcription factor domain-containing protein n=1 Tax=Stachybotrys elegans TaxID=80388 RepID=A0A8K0T4Y6_9HYPO|nr:hypothetical protein B0I35DRAFT_475192 [Stachybotrys elegans]